jgi:hypothetical protein
MRDRGRLVRALDRAAAAGALLWPAVYTWGPVPAPIGPPLTWRAWLAGLVAVLLVRHGLRPTPTIVSPLAARCRAAIADRGVRGAIGTAAATRALVLAVAVAATLLIPFPADVPELPGSSLWAVQARWDAFWYLKVARKGYEWDPSLDIQQTVAFFPAYPMLMRLAGDLVTIPAYAVGDPDLFGSIGDTRVLLGGTLANLAVFAWALVLLYRLARQDLTEDAARWAVIFTACYPFAVFYSAAYTEALFLLCSVGAVLAFRRDRYALAALCGVVLGLSRPNGFLLSMVLPLLGVEFARPRAPAPPRRLLLIGLACLAPAAGLALYSIYLGIAFGDPLAWARAQQSWGGRVGLSLVTMRYAHVQESGWLSYPAAYPYEAANTAALLFALAMTWWIRRLSWAYAAWVAVALLPAMLIDLPSLGRLTAPLFPIGLGLAGAVPARARPYVAGVFLGLQLVVAAGFYSWRRLY